jgi:hypothetical protein
VAPRPSSGPVVGSVIFWFLFSGDRDVSARQARRHDPRPGHRRGRPRALSGLVLMLLMASDRRASSANKREMMLDA